MTDTFEKAVSHLYRERAKKALQRSVVPYFQRMGSFAAPVPTDERPVA